ncbi:MAG: PqqD family peptide modification chaperone [Pseudomonadota bacterium]|nr:PqqD family peptide modification chaperone [Pseudomonadota bacterium]
MLKLPSADDALRLYSLLVQTRYTEQGLLQALGSVEPPMPQMRNLPRLLDQTQAPTPFNVLARWFLLGLPVTEATARRQLPPWFLDLAAGCELLRLDAAMYHPNVLLVPFGDRLVAADLYPQMASATHFDHVLTLNPAARYLLNFTIRRCFGSTLDLCTGCGIQALAAAAHSGQVIATDINPRAIAYTAFNARLNGFTNVECITGDVFAPVEGRTFDLIVCNPPFVLAPTRRYLYRDNDMELDHFCRRLVREAPAYLNEGGCFQMTCEWAELAGQPWQARLAEWFAASGCDVWVLKDYSRDPAGYAQNRIREMPQQSPQADADAYAEWLAYYREQGVVQIHGGLIAMRRRRGGRWLKIEEPAQPLQGPFGDAVAGRFAGYDFLQAHAADAKLLAARLRLAPQARLVRESRCVAGGWRTQSLRLTLTEGIPHGIGLDPEVAEFLGRFDGRHPVAELVEAVCTRLDADPAQVRAECLAMVRRLVEHGFLLPQNAGAAPDRQREA